MSFGNRTSNSPSFIKPLVDMGEILGSFVQISCKISGSLPISVQWQKDGSKVSSGVKHKLIQQDNSVSVEIEQLERSDAGSYSCKLTNAAGSCESSGSLMVKEPPSFVTLPESQAAVPNGTVRFKCTFKGTPPFTVKWFKDDSELMTGPSCFTGLEGLSCFMELYKVGVTHSGAYSCQVSNDAGSVRCSADLTVKGWPLSNSCVAVFISHLHRWLNSVTFSSFCRSFIFKAVCHRLSSFVAFVMLLHFPPPSCLCC
ncbi:hypothetical protein F7725_002646 [Dissostichus mawsoni]|uniref:Ig-like domain-containing protein n=1 Tax=Dissostichus mawsoni TaxID=36200 RepID=A0A7J5Y568_DISMA|nr:hypothetical protein F7725_002646 [Dissostichus mawsoni]